MTDWKFIAKKYWKKVRPGRFPEPLVLERLKSVRGNVFFDVGANTGIFTVPLRKNFKRIYAFEPDRETFNRLGSLAHNNIIPVRMAVSNRNGWAYLARPTDSCPTILEGFRLCPASQPDIDRFVTAKKGESVETVTIDRFRRLHGMETIDLVKIDVEGAEFLVLEGARQSFYEGRIQNVMVELHNRNRKQELETCLLDANFGIAWIDADHVLGVHKEGYCMDL
jgi:FkbM family methyltransferase